MHGIDSVEFRAIRDALRQAAGGLCSYCGCATGRLHGTVDHYLPRALGGTHAIGNLRWACLPCNAMKADMHPREWERVRPRPQEREPHTKAEKKAAAYAKIARRMREQHHHQRGIKP